MTKLLGVHGIGKYGYFRQTRSPKPRQPHSPLSGPTTSPRKPSTSGSPTTRITFTGAPRKARRTTRSPSSLPHKTF